MASIYKRGRVWWARASVRGEERRVSLLTHHEAVARAKLRDWLAEIGSQPYANSVRGSLGGMHATPTKPDGTIYAIGYGDKIKIGWTDGSAAYRRDCLQIGCPEDLQVFASRPGSRAAERALHRRFAAHHIRGEWFKLEGAVADWLFPADGPELPCQGLEILPA